MRAIAALIVPLVLCPQKMGSPDLKADDLTARIRDYRSWTRITKQPLVMEPQVETLCRPANALDARDDRDHTMNPPHAKFTDPFPGSKAFLIYANAPAAPGMAATGSPQFPAGSMIVKEKFSVIDFKRLPSGALPNPELLTVMVKGPRGTNVKLDDWRFFVLDGKPLRTDSGSTRHGESCHTAPDAQDFVFRKFGGPPISARFEIVGIRPGAKPNARQR